MKKLCSVILAVLLLLALFAGCKEDASSPVTASVASVGGQSSEAGEDASADDEKVIHLLTDLGNNALRAGAADSQYSAQEVMDYFLAKEDVLPEGYRLEVEVMPIDGPDFENRLNHLRTEIMSGKGPDIYVLSSADFAYKCQQERVFPNTKKAMEDGYFLNLDSYMDKAQFMEFDDMNPTVMAAGCTSAGRFVLPTRFTFNAIQVREPVSDPEAGWFDVVNGTDEVLAGSYAMAAARWEFQSIFEETVDPESKALTFSEEELYEAVAMALKLYGSDPANFPLEETVEIAPVDFSNVMLACWESSGNEDATYLPMRNREGGVSATVTSYIAINKNTPYPDEAFRVVDLMMGKKFQSGQKFWEKGYTGPTSAAAVFGWAKGACVYDDFLTESRPMNYVLYLDDKMYPVWCELRDKITDARIMHHVDQAMFDLCKNVQENGMVPGDELKKYVKQEYNKMVLMAGEL